nr:vacuolar iron transporter homolog 2-like [Tanacetum cinerariifolium]
MSAIPVNGMVHHQTSLELEPNDLFDYSRRSQWLRAAVLGATDGLVSTASLMMGIGAIKKDIKAMILIGFAGLVAGACSMAIGEFVSVYSQLDIEVAQMKRDFNRRDNVEAEVDVLPNPWQAAAASALAFSLGAMVPLLAASFIQPYKRPYPKNFNRVVRCICVYQSTSSYKGLGLGLVLAGWRARREFQVIMLIILLLSLWVALFDVKKADLLHMRMHVPMMINYHQKAC